MREVWERNGGESEGDGGESEGDGGRRAMWRVLFWSWEEHCNVVAVLVPNSEKREGGVQGHGMGDRNTGSLLWWNS